MIVSLDSLTDIKRTLINPIQLILKDPVAVAAVDANLPGTIIAHQQHGCK